MRQRNSTEFYFAIITFLHRHVTLLYRLNTFSLIKDEKEMFKTKMKASVCYVTIQWY